MAKILKAPRPTKEQKANPIAGLQGMKGVNTGLAGLTPEQLKAIQIANAMLLQNKYLNLGTTGGHTSFTESIGTEDTPAATFGDSQYDGSVTYNSDPSIINEQRYNAQGYLDIFGNSLAKAAGSFTTASLATVGLISNLIFQGLYSDSDSVSEYISQAATEGANKYVWNLDDWVRNNTEIYRSAEQKANDWHDAVNIFSGNTVGMLSDLLGFATSAAMTGGLAGSGFAALGMSAKGAGLAGSLVASLGEASIEAGHTKKEYLDAKTRELYSMAEKEYAKIASSEMYTPEQKQEALKQLELKIADTLEGIEQQSKTLGNATFLLNTALLSTGNFIHFGKYIGIKRAIKEEQSELLASYAKKVAAGEWTQEQYKQAVKKLDKLAKAKAAAMPDAPNFTLKGALGEEGAEYINKASKRHYLNFFKDTMVEGFEEMNQRVISEAEKKYSDQELNYIVKNKYKGATEADNPNFFASLIESAIDTYTDEEAWQEFALGFIGGGIGTPTITRNSEGKFRPKWVGSAFQSIAESKQKFADTQAIVDELNEYIKSDKFQEGVRDFRRLEVIRREKENAIIEGDLSKLEELEHKEFMLSAVTFAKHGRLGDLKKLYGKKITEEEAKAIIDKTTQRTEDGKLEGIFVDPNMPTETKSPAEVAAEINKINQEKLEQISQLSDLFGVLTAEFKDSLSKEEIADIAAAQMVAMKMLDNARSAATQFVEDLYNRGVEGGSIGEKSPLHRELSRVRDSLKLKAEKIQDTKRAERYTKEADKIQEFLDIMDELGKAKEANENSDVILEKLLKRNEEKVNKAKEAQEKLDNDKDKNSLSEEEVQDLEEAASYFTDLAEGYNGALKILDKHTHDNSTLNAIRTASEQIAKSYSNVINSFIKYRGASRTFEVLRIKGHAKSISQEAQAEEEGKSKEKKRKSKVEEYLASEEYNKLLAIGDHQAIKDKLNSLGATAAEKKRVELEFNKPENQKKYQFRTKALNFIRIWRDSYKDNPNSSLFQLMQNALSEGKINELIKSNRESVISNFLNSFNDNTNVTSFLSSLLGDEWSKLDEGMQKGLKDTATEIISKMNSLGSSANGQASTDANAIKALYNYALEVLNGTEPVEDVDKDEFKKALNELAFLSSPENTLKDYIKQFLDNVNALEKYKESDTDDNFRTLVDILEKIHKKLKSKQAPTQPAQTPQDEKDKIITEIEDILTNKGIDKTSIHGLDKVDLGTLKNFKQLIENTDFKSLNVILNTDNYNRADGTPFLQLNINHKSPLVLDAHNGQKIPYMSTHTVIIDAQGIELKKIEYGLEDLTGLESSLQSEQGDKEKLKWLEDNGFITQEKREEIEKKLDEGNKLDSINFLNLEEIVNLKITSIKDANAHYLQSIKDSGASLVDISYSNSGPSNTNNSNNASTSNANAFTNSTADYASTTITEFIEKQDGTFKLTAEGNAKTSAVELIKLTGGFTAVSTGQIPPGTELTIYRSIPKGFPNIDNDPVLKDYVGEDIKDHNGKNVAVLAYVDNNGNLVVIDIVSNHILRGIKKLLEDEHKAAWDADGYLPNATVKIKSFGNSSIPFHSTEYPDLSTKDDGIISMEDAINLGYVVPAFIDGSGEIVRIDGKGTVSASKVIYNDKLSLDEGKIIFLYKQADGLYYPAIGTVKRLNTGDSSRGVYVGVGDTSNSIVSNVRSNLIQIVTNDLNELAVGDKLSDFKESLLDILEETFYITSDLSIEILHSEHFKAKNGKPRTTISISTPHSNVNTKSGFNRKYITITDENGNVRDAATIVDELMNAFGELNLPFNVGKGLTAGDVTQRTSVNTVYNRAINGRLYYKPLAVSYDGTSYTIVTNENPTPQSNGTSTGISSNSSEREEQITVVAPDNSEATIRLTLQGNRLLNSKAFLRVNGTDIDGNLTVEEEKLGNSTRRALVLAYLLLESTTTGVTKEDAEAIIKGFSEGNATLDFTGPKEFHITFSDSTSSAHIMVSDGKIHIVRNRTNTKSIVAKESDTPIEGAVDISSDMFNSLKSAEDTDVTTTDTTYQIKEEGSNTAVEYQRVTSLTPLKYSENSDYTVLREMGNIIESFVVEEIKKHFNNNVPLENLHPIVRDLLSRLEGYKFVQDKKLLYGNIKVEGNDTNVAGVPDLIFYNEDTKRVVIIDVKTSFQNYIPGYNVMYNSNNFDIAYGDNSLSKADSYRAQLLRYRQLLVNNLGLKEDQVSLYVLPIKWNTISGHTSNSTVGTHYRNIDTKDISINDLKLEINTVHYTLKGVGFNMSNEREGAGLLPIGYNVDNGSKFIPGDTTGIERSPEESSTGINNAEESANNIIGAFELRSSEVFRQLPTTPTIDIKRELAWLASKLPNVNRQMAVAIYDRVFRIASSGIEVYGMYKNGVIYLAENGPAGTLYHEAFHAVYRTLLTEEERLEVYREMKELYPDKTPIQIEEILAEKFAEYTMGLTYDDSIKGRIIRFFRMMKEMLKNFLRINSEMDRMFYNIHSGKYGNREVSISTDVANNTIYDLRGLEFSSGIAPTIVNINGKPVKVILEGSKNTKINPMEEMKNNRATVHASSINIATISSEDQFNSFRNTHNGVYHNGKVTIYRESARAVKLTPNSLAGSIELLNDSIDSSNVTAKTLNKLGITKATFNELPIEIQENILFCN